MALNRMALNRMALTRMALTRVGLEPATNILLTVPVSRQIRVRRRLQVLSTTDRRGRLVPWQNFLNPEFGTKFQRKVPFYRDTRIFLKHGVAQVEGNLSRVKLVSAIQFPTVGKSLN